MPFIVAWAITCCQISMLKSQVHAGLCISKERKQEEGEEEARGWGCIYVVFVPLSFCLTQPHPLLSPLISPSYTLSCEARCGESRVEWLMGNNLGQAIRVNGVKVSAGRPGDAEKSWVKVTALYCCITGCFKLGTQQTVWAHDFTVTAEFHDHCEWLVRSVVCALIPVVGYIFHVRTSINHGCSSFNLISPIANRLILYEFM